jgi:pimeloyl-ACP methyl ester carboxylesterase
VNMHHSARWRTLVASTCLGIVSALAVAAVAGMAASPSETVVVTVASKDGTPISVECTGTGPTLLIVHGGTGDRTRWTPLFPLMASRLTVCAMDRRGHGTSGDSADYSLQKEAEDVVAVVNSRPGKVFVLGHSYGGVAALEAAFLTDSISRLVLYEPPLQDLDNAAILARMERLIAEGDREEALTTFFREIVMISPSEIAAMKGRPSWPGLLASIETSIRQDRALGAYRFSAARMRGLQTRTLLLSGSKTASPQLKLAIDSLQRFLPHAELVAFQCQEHNAMDTVPQQFADTVLQFLFAR